MESTKTRILTVLRSHEGYLSGQELCSQLGISRTAVWKYMKQLKEEGYQIQAVPNKGYCLIDVPDILGESEISSRLTTKWAGRNVYFLEETDSTNLQAKHLADAGAVSGTLVVTDCQTKGRGRRGRMWESPRGSSVYMTLLMRPEILPGRASMLTLVMGLSVAQVIQKVLELEKSESCVQIKWPNDVVLSGKKLVGILTEMNAQIDYIEYLVIGVGINVNTGEFPEELKDKATSLLKELGHPVNRAQLIAEIMQAFEKNYGIFEKTQDLSGLIEDYQAISANYQQPVRVLEPGNEYTGIARGINKLGELLVEREDGTVENVYSGEVSVRGLYSYV